MLHLLDTYLVVVEAMANEPTAGAVPQLPCWAQCLGACLNWYYSLCG
jgi:hypothetical protein